MQRGKIAQPYPVTFIQFGMMNDRLSVRRNERWRLLLPTGVRRPDSRSFPFCHHPLADAKKNAATSLCPKSEFPTSTCRLFTHGSPCHEATEIHSKAFRAAVGPHLRSLGDGS